MPLIPMHGSLIYTNTLRDRLCTNVHLVHFLLTKACKMTDLSRQFRKFPMQCGAERERRRRKSGWTRARERNNVRMMRKVERDAGAAGRDSVPACVPACVLACVHFSWRATPVSSHRSNARQIGRSRDRFSWNRDRNRLAIAAHAV